MPTLESSGTCTADGTQQTLAALTTNKTFVLCVDMGAMVNGEEVELKIYTKCLTGGTSRIAYYAYYTQVQGTPQKFSVPVPSDIEFKATLKQVLYVTAYKDFPWKILSL